MKEERPSVRENIFAETIRLFGERGFDGTPIQAIADAVGIRKPSLLYHFSSKDELGDEVMKLLVSTWEAKLPELHPETTSGPAVFEAVIESLVAFFQEDRNRARLVLREALDRPEKMKQLVHEHLNPWMDRLSSAIRLGQQNGVIRQSVDPISYITGILIMAIAISAMGDLAAVFFGSRQDSTALTGKEFVRIAYDSLFIE